MADEILAGTGGAGTDVVAEALSRYIIMAAYGNNKLLGTVRIDTPDGAVIKRYRKNPVLVDSELTEIESIVNSAFVKTEATVETKRYGLATEMSDLNAMLGIQSLAEVGVEMGKAIGAGIETRIALLYPDFDATALGTTDVDMTLAVFLAMRLELDTKDLQERGQYVFAAHPKTMDDLRQALHTATGTAFGSDIFGAESLNPVAEEWRLWGIRMVSTTKVPTANVGVDYVSAMYPERQLGPIVYQEQRAPRAVPVRGQSGERSSSTAMIATTFYGVGMIDDIAGAQAISAVISP